MYSRTRSPTIAWTAIILRDCSVAQHSALWSTLEDEITRQYRSWFHDVHLQLDTYTRHRTRPRHPDRHQHGFSKKQSSETQPNLVITKQNSHATCNKSPSRCYLAGCLQDIWRSAPHSPDADTLRSRSKKRNTRNMNHGSLLDWQAPFSSWMVFASGVPQGTLMARPLFFTFISGLSDCVNIFFFTPNYYRRLSPRPSSGQSTPQARFYIWKMKTKID